ncbi:hypothetical protein CLOSTHATH_00420 [Hungatella hathewayi DSM 13479]|uniref:Uncharacterized protein n=1 Tax=Hungatella hathewayi DSM 13479 TaxID=566550 RepID=D3AA00_9FIRM|nr:hypothetical protein CLOSTHATH_00420 [Hungatella hathewayi DSM 13479]
MPFLILLFCINAIHSSIYYQYFQERPVRMKKVVIQSFSAS